MAKISNFSFSARVTTRRICCVRIFLRSRTLVAFASLSLQLQTRTSPSSARCGGDPRNFEQDATGLTKHLCIQRLAQQSKPAPTIHGECNMKMLVTKMLVSTALLATLVAADTAYAQTYRDRAPATADDSWESGEYGPPVRVQPGDVIEDGRIVGKDPDPNIRTQLQREYPPGGDGY
jgi:hypothetical protein